MEMIATKNPTKVSKTDLPHHESARKIMVLPDAMTTPITSEMAPPDKICGEVRVRRPLRTIRREEHQRVRMDEDPKRNRVMNNAKNITNEIHDGRTQCNRLDYLLTGEAK